MSTALWPKYRLFPYEEKLAEAELGALTGRQAIVVEAGLRFTGNDKIVVDRSTYFSGVSASSGELIPTAQHLVESHYFDVRGSSSVRQSTRFLTHGFHEYKGKFNPQMARALINVADPTATSLLDPFCGSGTTLVEAARLGLAAAGIDRHPLAIFMTLLKIDVMDCPNPTRLGDEFDSLAHDVAVALKRGQDEQTNYVPTSLTDAARQYLVYGLPRQLYPALYSALEVVDGVRDELAPRLVLLSLSAILRSVSLQVPEDLRIRRQPEGFIAPSVAERFSAQVEVVSRGLSELLAFRRCGPKASIIEGSADDQAVVARAWAPGRKLIITSPPYATALPYIDTDRLSLVYLGLASPRDIRRLEMVLFGSREWGTVQSRSWQAAMESNRDMLPTTVTELLVDIAQRNASGGAGFRRAAVPALLYRYFSDMGRSFQTWSKLQSSGERAVLVVGRNRTGPATARQVIDTPRLLADVAAMSGYRLVHQLPFETWPRYGLHADNGVLGEDAIVLERT